MGRIRTEVVVAGRTFWPLFDTGARNSYVVEDVASLLPTVPLDAAVHGTLAMQEWGIVPIPREERLDMTHYPREFVEF